jgi:phosphoglycerate kinase
MENLRFHAEETDNDEDFARQLAEGADIYINEAFSTSHRAHASTVTITKFIEQAAAGYLLLHEIEIFENVLNNPNRPFVSIIGGIKVFTKIGVIENLLGVCDEILIGGAMACTFFESLGIMAGSSLCEHDQMDTARRILEKAGATEPKTGQLLLPLDAIVTDKISPNGKRVIASFDSIPEGMTVVDIGPDTIARFRKQIENAQTIIMNGPLGVFEIEQFSHGTREIFKMLVERAESGANVVIGGGDSAYAARKYGFDTHMTHVSTGGGASLKFLEGKPLPAVEALTEKS